MQVNSYDDKEVEKYLICRQADTTERQTYAKMRKSGTATKTPMVTHVPGNQHMTVGCVLVSVWV